MKQSGFTIFEVLIALSISALLAVGTYQLLGSVTLNEGEITTYNEQLMQLDRAFNRIGNDVQAINAHKNSRAGEYDMFPAITVDDFADYVSFTIGGVVPSPWQKLKIEESGDQAPALSQFQRVTYHKESNENDNCRFMPLDLEEEQLEGLYCVVRTHWQYVDRERDDDGQVATVIAGVKSLEWQFHYRSGNSIDSAKEWPIDTRGDEQASLIGIELIIDHFLLGEVSRYWSVAGHDRLWQGMGTADATQ